MQLLHTREPLLTPKSSWTKIFYREVIFLQHRNEIKLKLIDWILMSYRPRIFLLYRYRIFSRLKKTFTANSFFFNIILVVKLSFLLSYSDNIYGRGENDFSVFFVLYIHTLNYTEMRQRKNLLSYTRWNRNWNWRNNT